MPIYLQYYFWLCVVSAGVFALERLFAARPQQEVIREDFVQDLFWMMFNTQYMGWMLAILSVHTAVWLNTALFHFGLPHPESIGLLTAWPIWLQFVAFFVTKDFLEWNIHRGLHRVPWLWEVHKLHHSSERLDWLAAFRSHWLEIIIYKLVIYLPLVVLGVNANVIFAIVIVSLLMQELVHANLDWDWGPLRYVINSPRLHAWHHSVEMHGQAGQNFSINLSIWDWVFRTAYWPGDNRRPDRLGFEDMNRFPKTVWARLWSPFLPGNRHPAESPTTVPEHLILQTPPPACPEKATDSPGRHH